MNTRRSESNQAAKRGALTPAEPAQAKSYHHGALREALLDAAERILKRDGIQGLTLRAAAREAGVSHAAPKNHFGDLKGLLSDLAAIGFERLRAAMVANIREGDPTSVRMETIGQGYVAFAKANPALFLLIFRRECLDFGRPALAEAARAAFDVLSGTVAERRQESLGPEMTLSQAAQIAASWSLVHGFAMLLIDGMLPGLIARLPAGADDEDLLNAILSNARTKE